MKKVLLILGLIGFMYGQSFSQACTGTPMAGTASGPATICAGSFFTLTLSGYDTGTGITFQWQSSTDGVTFTDISGAMADNYSTSVTDTTYYQCVVTCSGSGMSATSNVVTVNAAFYFCYCTSSLHVSSSPCINNVKFVSIDNSSSFCSLPAYTFYDPATATTTITQGGSYPISVTTDGDNIISVWIDYDHSGTFDPSEWTQIATTSTAGTPSIVTVNVPISALTGITGMRVRARAAFNPNGAGDACTTFGSGETEDYIVNIAAAVPCTGTPTAGNATSTDVTVCSGVNFTLDIDSPPVGASGITYQWQSSPDGITYTDIPGATSEFYTTSQSSDTYYQLIVTCSGSGMSTTSTPIQVTMNSFFLCYCNDSYALNTGDTKIDSVEVDGIMTGSDPSTCETYTDYTGVTGIDMQIFGPNPVRVRNGSCSGFHYAAYVAIYIDYNQNGDYTDAGEQAATYGPTTGLNTIPILNITPPLSALPGMTGMRIAFSEGSIPPPCGTYSFGETEDYVVNLIPAPACSGMPTPGSATTSMTNVCPGETATLSDAGSTVASDLTYQWQESADGVTYTDIAGATTFNYDVMPSDTTMYQLVITCPSSSMTAVSAPVTVYLNPFYMCYCNDNLYAYEYPCIENVTVNTLNNSDGSCSMPSWTFFPPVGSATTDLAELTNYTLSVTDDGSAIVSMWMDYDHSGTFDPSEWTQVTTHSASFTPSSVVINIPNTALLGLTGMRIRTTYYYNSNGPSDACSYFYGGETEDYVVNLLAAPPCTNPPVGGVITGPATDSVGNTGNYSLGGGFNGDSFQWYVSFDGGATYSIVTGATDSTLNYTYNSAQDPTFMVVASSGGCVSDTSQTFTTNIITNDNVCEAFPLMIGTNGPYDLTGFSAEPGEMAPPALGCSTPMGWCNSTINGSMWFTIVAPPSGRITIQSPDFDTQLALWKADSCSAMTSGTATLVAANDDDPDASIHGGVTFSSYISIDAFCLTPGETYWVQLDPYGSASTTSVIVTDLGPAASPVVTLNDSIFCASVVMDAGPGSSFLWNTGDTTETATFNTDGIVWVTVIDSLGCQDTDSATITNNAPLASFTSTQVSIGIFTFTNTSTPPSSEVSATYSWNFGDGGASAVENPSHIYTTNGTYIVTLTITNACGTDAITQTVVVNGVGVAELNTDNTVKIYPNPAVEVLNISSGTNITSIELFDAAGQRVIVNANVNSTQYQVSLGQLARGMYTITVNTTAGVSRSRITVVR